MRKCIVAKGKNFKFEVLGVKGVMHEPTREQVYDDS